MVYRVGSLLLILCILAGFVFIEGVRQKNDEGQLETSGDWRVQRDLEVVRKEPSEPAAHQQLANSYLALGDYERSAQEYQRAISLSTNVSPGLYCALGNAMLRCGQITRARAAWKQEIERDMPVCHSPQVEDTLSIDIKCAAFQEAQRNLKAHP